MNYQKIYDDICKRGQERELPKEVYTEKHHIIPKCLGGGNSKENLTILTAREHFICHLILARKLYSENSKLWYALHKMMYSVNDYQDRYIPNGKLYESIRIEINQRIQYLGTYQLGKSWEELFGIEKAYELKQNCSNRMTGQIVTEQKREKCRLIHLEKRKTEEQKNKLSKFRKDNFLCGDNMNAKRIKHIETGMIFSSQKEAAIYFGVVYYTIWRKVKRGEFEILGLNRKLPDQLIDD